MTLFEHLSNFKRHSSEEKLTAAFEKLAPHFIYGGYIKVNDAYRVYIFVPLNFTTMMRATNRMQSKTQSCITGIIQK